MPFEVTRIHVNPRALESTRLRRLVDGIEVYAGSVGHGVQWDTVTEYHVVPVHRTMCKYTIIPSSPCPTEQRVPLNPRIPLIRPPALPLPDPPPLRLVRRATGRGCGGRNRVPRLWRRAVGRRCGLSEPTWKTKTVFFQQQQQQQHTRGGRGQPDVCSTCCTSASPRLRALSPA